MIDSAAATLDEALNHKTLTAKATDEVVTAVKSAQLFDIGGFLALHRVRLVGMVKRGALLNRLFIQQVSPPTVEHVVVQLPKNSFGVDEVDYFATPLRAAQLSTSPLCLQGNDFIANFGYGISKAGFFVNLDHLLKINLTANGATIFSNKTVFVFKPDSQRVHRLAANTALIPGDLLLAGIYVLQI